MGLDMYVFAMTGKLAQPVDFPEPKAVDELHYWRKHPNLHGWMQMLYEAKGGVDPDFNLSGLVLEGCDLDRLEAAILAGTLPPTSGFFFGESDGSELEDDLVFVHKARAAIKNGRTIFYVASW